MYLFGLNTEFIDGSSKFAGPKLCVLMSMVISSIFTHGFIPRSMMDSVIVPVIKNKNKRINDKGNYRPICLSTVCSKIVEMAIARRLSDSLNSSHNQFGFKLDHGTELCVLVTPYKSEGSQVRRFTSPKVL